MKENVNDTNLDEVDYLIDQICRNRPGNFEQEAMDSSSEERAEDPALERVYQLLQRKEYLTSGVIYPKDDHGIMHHPV